MNETCIDSVFGEMTYKHRWFKQEMISLFDKEWSVTVVAKAYLGKPIVEAQRASYQRFNKHRSEFIDIVGSQLIIYINDTYRDLSLYWNGAKSIMSKNELSGIIIPKTLLIKQDGTTIFLFDCPWDEHGIAVQIIPDIQIGSQDAFL